jgi:hypothetical protein
VVNISGNTSSSATGTALYLQTSGGTEVARGFLAKYGTVNFIPSSEIAVSTAGATYELVANTQTLMEQENVAGICEGLQLSTTLGTAASAGDIRWFDNAVDPLYPMTWLNGASPITASICY